MKYLVSSSQLLLEAVPALVNDGLPGTAANFQWRQLIVKEHDGWLR